ncbi:MAG: hypothetical protein JWM57_2039 [Phycisphaerales bacterium]|nr:hypothetical protein [Phycisphaerales bacterium]
MLAQALPNIDSLSSLGAAGLIGAMWLWERRQSTEREKQLDEAHTRILADRVQLDALIELVQHSTETLSKLALQQDALLRRLDKQD